MTIDIFRAGLALAALTTALATLPSTGPSTGPTTGPTTGNDLAAWPTAAVGALAAAPIGAAGASGVPSLSDQSIEWPEPDSVRLLTDLSVLSHDSLGGRATGTPGSEGARAFIARSLRASGVRTLGSEYEHPFTGEGGPGVNVVGIVRGTERPDAYIVLTAHYDHLGVRGGATFNGADDNASGTAAMLAAAREAVARPLRASLILVALDAEEQGLSGARAFVAEPPVPVGRIELNINLDMVARTGGLLWASGAHHTPALRPILDRVAAGAPLTLRLGHDRAGALEGDDWTHSSDHGPFHAAGIPFVYFGVEDHPDYHKPTDDFVNVDPGDYMNSVRTILAAMRSLDASLPLPASQPTAGLNLPLLRETPAR